MLTIKSSVFLKKLQRFFQREKPPVRQATPPPLLLTLSSGYTSADTAARRWRRLYALGGRGEGPPSAAGECRAHGRGKRGQDTRYGFLSPLDSPYLPLAATPFGRAAKRELRGLGSGRRADFGTLSGPEVSLRKPPRITVRGHSVQGANAVAAADRHDADISRTQKEHRFASVLFRVM